MNQNGKKKPMYVVCTHCGQHYYGFWSVKRDKITVECSAGSGCGKEFTTKLRYRKPVRG